MTEGKRKLAAVVFTDFVGYSKVTHTNEKLGLELLAEHRRIIEPCVTEFNGRVIQTIGDGFLLEFGSANEAAEFSLKIQDQFKVRNRTVNHERIIQVRVGIHLADIISGEEDIFGDGVNIAARLHALAPPSGICLSQQVFDQIRGRLGRQIHKIGRRKLKNIRGPMMVYQLESTPATLFRTQLASVRRPSPIVWFAIFLATIVLWLDRNTPNSEKTFSGPRRVAVLPFKTVGLKPEDEFIPEGITEEIITSLSKLPGVHVLARSSVRKFQNTKDSVAEIGRTLNVGSVVEGRVIREGDKIHISARIIDVTTEEYVWSQHFDGALTKLFSIQKTISERVAKQLKVRALASVDESEKFLTAKEHEAYVTFLRGRYLSERRTREDFLRAIDYFKSAIEMAPNFARAYGAIATTYDLMAFYGHLDAKDAFPKGMDYAMKALTLDPQSQEAYLFLGEKFMTIDRNWSESEKNFQKAIQLNPRLSTAHQWYSDLLVAVSRFAEAKKESALALELEPLSTVINRSYARMLYNAGEYDAAIRAYKSALELDPHSAATYHWLGLTYAMKKDFKNAISVLEKALSLSGGDPMIKGALGFAYGKAGRNTDAQKILRSCAALRGDMAPFVLAQIHVGMGNIQEAFENLNRAAHDRNARMAWVGVAPEFSNLHSDPRWSKLMLEMKLTRP